MPYQLIDTADGRVLGTLTDEQFQELTDALEEESLDDRDYYLNVDTVDMLEDQAVDEGLVKLLRTALGDRDEIDVSWQEI
ncbi:MAG: CoA transferase [Sporichthyaceae bacterium]|nr:CoA transferase [Sporichthyaceae bacterium]